MSRRIVYVFAACAAFAAPADADPECFDNVCRMPDVLETPQAPAVAVEEGHAPDAVPQAEQRSGPVPIRPQMRVDDLPRPALRPLPVRPVQQTPDRPARQIARPAPRQSDVPGEPPEFVNRPYAGAAQPPASAPSLAPSQPNAGVIVVVPGLQHGDDGMALVRRRQDNYQPLGSQGYRPLGIYRPSRAVPTYVYVPDAKILTIDGND